MLQTTMQSLSWIGLWEGRSRSCWLAATYAVQALDSETLAHTGKVGHVYKPNGGGNYTGCIMRVLIMVVTTVMSGE